MFGFLTDLFLIDSRVGNNAAQRGGGIAIDGGKAEIIRSVLLANDAASAGGGLYGLKCALKIQDTKVEENRAGPIEGYGGGLSLQTATAEIVNTDFTGNKAAISGGAMFAHVNSIVNITASKLWHNNAPNGGGIRIFESSLVLQNCDARSNSAVGASQSGTALGGFLSIAALGHAELVGTDLRNNTANGPTARGGAVWSEGKMLRIVQGTLSNNTVVASGRKGKAEGGAIFLASRRGAMAVLNDCSLVVNSALIIAPAIRANAGAVWVGAGATANLSHCTLRHNNAGGTGAYQVSNPIPSPQVYAQAAIEERDSSAAHIYSEGHTILERSVITDEVGLASKPHAAWWWIVAEVGSIVLRHSDFTSSASYVFDPCPYATNGRCNVATGDCSDGDYEDCATPAPAVTEGKLLNVRSKNAEALIGPGVTVMNLSISSAQELGVLNSTFEPPLDSSVPTVQPPRCGKRVAGEPLCDPRALCQPRLSGGVQCTFTCGAGSRGSGLNCTICERGYFSNVTSAAACFPCNAG